MQPRVARRCGSAARLTRNGAVRFTASTRSHSASSMSSTRPNWGTPATLATTSSRPWASTTPARAASTAARSVTSPATTSTPSGPSPRRSNPTTVAPSSRNRSATARPMPEAHPVTKATRRGPDPAPLLSSLTAAVCHPARDGPSQPGPSRSCRWRRSARDLAAGPAARRRAVPGRVAGRGGAARLAARRGAGARATPRARAGALVGPTAVRPAGGRRGRGGPARGRGRRRGARRRPVDRCPALARVGPLVAGAGAGPTGGVAGPRAGGGRRRPGRAVRAGARSGPVGARRAVGVPALAATVPQQGADRGAGAVRAARQRLVPDGLDQRDQAERGDEDDHHGDGGAPPHPAQALPQASEATLPVRGRLGPPGTVLAGLAVATRPVAALPTGRRRADGQPPRPLPGEPLQQALLELELPQAALGAAEAPDVQRAADDADDADDGGAEHGAGDAEERGDGRPRHRRQHRAQHLDARDPGAVVGGAGVAATPVAGGRVDGSGIGAGAGRAHSGRTARSSAADGG